MNDRSPIIRLPDPTGFDRSIEQFLAGFPLRSRRVDLQQVAALSRYFARLPFENLTKLIKLGKAGIETRFRLPDEVTEDHLRWNLGGTCFSLTYFLVGILRSRGLQADPVMCHMNYGPNTHTAIILSYEDQRYFLDPGYLVHEPLPLKNKTVQRMRSSGEGVALEFQEEMGYVLYTYRQGQKTRRYHFEDRPVSLDIFGQRWHESFDLPLMDGICLTRNRADEMIYIHNDYLKITRSDGIMKVRDWNKVQYIIREQFNIPLERVEEARQILKENRP